MAQKLDEQGNPIVEKLDESGNPITTAPARAPIVSAPVAEDPGLLSKAYDWATTSLLGYTEPTPEEMIKDPRGSQLRNMAMQFSTPLAIGGELLGATGLIKGIKGLRSRVPAVAAKAAEIPIPKVTDDILGDLQINPNATIPTGPIQFQPPAPVKPMFNPKGQTGMTGSAKPRVRVNSDGTFTNLDTGEIIPPNKPPVVPPTVPPKPSIEPPAKKVPESSWAREIYELPRGIMSVDIPFMTSAAFRQGAGLAGTPNWFRSYAKAARAGGSEKAYDAIMAANKQNIIHKENVMLLDGKLKHTSVAEQIGLAESSLKGIRAREEQIRSSLVERFPIVGRWARSSNRSYTAFLNTLRTQTAEDWLKAYGAMNENGIITDMVTAKQIGRTINELTGHGSLRFREPIRGRFGKSNIELNLEGAHDFLTLGLFSPRLLARDARMMNPLNYIKTPDLLRKQYLLGAIRRAGVWASFTTLGGLLGANVSSDITNSDFGKIKIGDTRLDAGTGLLQWLVLGGRQALGYTTSSSNPRHPMELGSEPLAPNRWDVATDFFLNRVHPTLGLGIEAARAQEYRPFAPASETIERLMPMFSNDLIEIMQSNPEEGQILLGLIGVGGSMGTMTYGDRPEKPLLERTLGIEEPKFEGGSFFGR